MKSLGKDFVSTRIIAYEIIAFTAIVMIIWLDEVLDIPFRILGAPPTPANWRESLFESIIIIIIGTVIVYFSRKIFQRLKYLEGILPVCASCKKIRDQNGDWNQIESYISVKSEAQFSHGICPECAKTLYPDMDLDKN